MPAVGRVGRLRERSTPPVANFPRSRRLLIWSTVQPCGGNDVASITLHACSRPVSGISARESSLRSHARVMLPPSVFSCLAPTAPATASGDYFWLGSRGVTWARQMMLTASSSRRPARFRTRCPFTKGTTPRLLSLTVSAIIYFWAPHYPTFRRLPDCGSLANPGLARFTFA